MAVITVTRESDTTNARHVVLTQKNNAGAQVVAGADAPEITIDVNHQRNHDGRAFYAYKIAPDSAPLAADASINIVMASPSGVYPHVTIDGTCLGESELYIYENTTTTGGTAFTPINRNRNYAVSNPSQVAMVVNPTVTSVGDQLSIQIIPAGSGKKSTGSSAGSLEFVLKPLTNYLFRLTNVDTAAHAASLQLEWYE